MKNKKTTFWRILPLFLAITLCIMMQDMVAFAAETGETTECNHMWDRGVTTREAKCFVSGEITFTCLRCGAIKKVETSPAAMEHKWASKVIAQPTCISAGITEYTCIRCEEKRTEVIPIDPDAHNWTNEVTKEPTELTKGIYTSNCDLCHKNETYTLLLAKTGYYNYCPTQKSKLYAVVYTDTSLSNGSQSKIESGTKIYVFENEDSSAQATRFCYPIGTTKTAYLSSKNVIIITDEYRVPDKIMYVRVSPDKKKMKISWKKNDIADGYQITYATNSKLTKGKRNINIKTNNTVKTTIKKLKSKKKYYVAVRGYRKVNGKTIYGPYSAVRRGVVK